MLGGLPFVWLVLGGADGAVDVLWVWREAWRTQIRDAKDNAGVPRAAGASEEWLPAVPGTGVGIRSNPRYGNAGDFTDH